MNARILRRVSGERNSGNAAAAGFDAAQATEAQAAIARLLLDAHACWIDDGDHAPKP